MAAGAPRRGSAATSSGGEPDQAIGGQRGEQGLGDDRLQRAMGLGRSGEHLAQGQLVRGRAELLERCFEILAAQQPGRVALDPDEPEPVGIVLVELDDRANQRARAHEVVRIVAVRDPREQLGARRDERHRPAVPAAASCRAAGELATTTTCSDQSSAVPAANASIVAAIADAPTTTR